MRQPRLLLLGLLSLFVLLTTVAAGPAGLPAVSWRDAQGNPAAVYLEGSRAFVQVTDAAANLDPGTAETVQVQASSARAHDAETVPLTETGPDTGVFRGSIRLDLTGTSGDGRLETGLDIYSAPMWDTLTASYGAATATAATFGSITDILDSLGSPASTSRIGDPVRIRVQAPIDDTTPAVDTTTVYVTQLGNNNDAETVTLTETGGSTGVFEGSLPTAALPAYFYPTQNDDVLQLRLNDPIFVQHADANGQTTSEAQAAAIVDLPDSIQLVTDATEMYDPGHLPQPVTQAYQRSTVFVRATSGAATGQGPLQAQVSSLLRGDTRTVLLSESSSTFGLFYGSFTLDPRLPWDPFNNSDLQILEDPGPPHRDDTVKAVLSCATPPCPQVQVPTVASTLRFLDTQGNVLTRLPIGSDVVVELRDYTSFQQMLVTLQARPGGDTQTVTFGAPLAPGLYRATLPTEHGPAVTGDGRLQLDDAGTLTATHANSLGISSSTATVDTGSAGLQFLDRLGNPTDFLWESSKVRVRAIYAQGNVNPGIADTASVTAVTKDIYGNVRDTETIQITETGPDTGVFTGQIPLWASPSTVPQNGTLESWSTNNQDTDTVTVSLGASTLTGAILPGRLWFVDANGATVTQVTLGSRLSLRGEGDVFNSQPDDANFMPVTLHALTTGSTLSLTLNETGLDTGLFAGFANTGASPPPPGLVVQTGEQVEATTTYGVSRPVTARVTVAPNRPPAPQNDTATTAEDSPVSISVLSNDSDPDGDPFTLAAVTVQPAHGSAVLQSGGTIAYMPAHDYNGTDSLRYSVIDGNGGTAEATVAITVTPVNDPPVVATGLTINVLEDTPLTFTINVSDPENDPVTLVSVSGPADGVLTANANGSFNYTPALNANGLRSFTYRYQDSHGAAADGASILSILPVNDPPVAVDDAFTIDEDDFSLFGLTGNDSDVDGDPLVVAAVTQPAHGTAVIATSATQGAVFYTPAANYNGTDSFTYTIADPSGATSTATVRITLNPINDPPVANADSATTPEDTAVTINVKANDSDVDGDSLSVTGVTQPAHGAAAYTASGVTYTPAANYNGPDSFSYTISDGHGRLASAAVSVTVTPVNDPPIAVNDTGTTREGVAVTVPVLANDSDIEGSPLTVTAVSTPAHGGATFSASAVTYTPAANFNGTDSFTYTVSDGAATKTATVTITVKDALERVALLATSSASLLTGSDVLSGDVVVNQSGAGPFLAGGVELNIAGTVTTPAGWDVDANRVTVAAGATLASDVFSNQLNNSGTITGTRTSTLSLPIFSSLPAFNTATPSTTTDVSVGTNGSRTLAPGSYRDLIVGKKGTVIFTGGVYHFRSIRATDVQVKLLFSAASEVRVQQKVQTLGTATIGPNTGATVTAAGIVFYVAGINGTGGGLTETPKAVEIGTDNTLTANIYAPNGELLLGDRTAARGAFLARDIQIGPDVQVTLQSAWSGQ